MGTESVAELNAAHLSSRASALDSAIQGALASRGAAPPAKAPKAAAAPVVASAAEVPPAAPVLEEPDAVAEPLESDDPAEPLADGDDGEGDGAEAIAADLSELQELGKKKDLRALEKKLGLEEGTLGVKNGDYAVYRRRCDELDADRAKQQANEATLIRKFGPVVDLIQAGRGGDLKAVGATFKAAFGITVEQFIDHWSKNAERIDPRIIQLEEENTRLRAPAPKADPETKTPADARAAATKKADDFIQAEAGSHPAFKLSGAVEGIRKLWLESHKGNGQFGLSPKQAAGEFIKLRQAEREREAWILSGKTPPPKPRTKALARTGANETQVRTENLSREQLIERGAQKWRQEKRRDEAKR
jgi:hypothetical protein